MGGVFEERRDSDGVMVCGVFEERRDGEGVSVWCV